jgi:hypothetical protein
MQTRRPGPAVCNRSGANNQYTPRYCSCGAIAGYAVQVLARTIGKGQGQRTRKMKLSTTRLLCAECSLKIPHLEGELGVAGFEALKFVRRPPQTIPGASLFEQVEAS